MSLFTFIADITGVTAQLRRIADALDRAYPIPPVAKPPKAAWSSKDEPPPQHYMAESPEQYQARINNQSDLATSLGVAPWSPDFQALIDEMRKSLQQPRMEMNEDNEYHEVPGYDEAEADRIVREAFDLAQRYATAQTSSAEGNSDSHTEP